MVLALQIRMLLSWVQIIQVVGPFWEGEKGIIEIDQMTWTDTSSNSAL